MARELDEMLETGYAEMIKSYPFSILDGAEDEGAGPDGEKEEYIPNGMYVFDDDDGSPGSGLSNEDDEDLDCVVICKANLPKS